MACCTWHEENIAKHLVSYWHEAVNRPLWHFVGASQSPRGDDELSSRHVVEEMSISDDAGMVLSVQEHADVQRMASSITTMPIHTRIIVLHPLAASPCMIFIFQGMSH